MLDKFQSEMKSLPAHSDIQWGLQAVSGGSLVLQQINKMMGGEGDWSRAEVRSDKRHLLQVTLEP